LKKKGRLMADLIASQFHMPDMAALSTSLCFSGQVKRIGRHCKLAPIVVQRNRWTHVTRTP